MERTISGFVLEVTKKLHEYELDRKSIATEYEEENKESQQFFLGKADGFSQAADIIAELATKE